MSLVNDKIHRCNYATFFPSFSSPLNKHFFVCGYFDLVIFRLLNRCNVRMDFLVAMKTLNGKLYC